MTDLDKVIEILENEMKDYNPKYHEWYSGVMRALTHAKNVKQAGINTNVSGKLAYHQLCPKCFGEGHVSNIGVSTSLFRICPVCNGAKTLIVPNCQPACDNGWEAQSQSDDFYCADWNRCGAICEEQCPACKKADRAELL
jgi:DnaJ-class molecular chaperone